MRIIQPEVLIWPTSPIISLKNIERAGRVCYKSEDKITDDSFVNMIKMLVKNGHHSVLEHEKVTVTFIIDRGISHEVVRHRLAAYSQESTRYCNYSGDKFGNEITVIEPFFFSHEDVWMEEWGNAINLYSEWYQACQESEKRYFRLLKLGASPQEARSVLPNSLKTEIVVTYDLREWRHFLTLRAAITAHPQMRQVAIPLLLEFKNNFCPLFDDIEYDETFNPNNYAKVFILK